MASRRSRQPVRWPSPPDPENSTDRQIRELVRQLRQLPAAPRPDDDFRRDLRLQLVSVAPRLVAEGATERGQVGVTKPAPAHAEGGHLPAGAAHADVHSPAQLGRRLASAIARPFRVRAVAIVAGALAVLLVLFGGAVLLSRNSLPGDSLYGLKRARENVQLNLTSGKAAKGHAYLVQAQTRVEEVTELLAHPTAIAAGYGVAAAGAISPATAALVRKTLDSSDADLQNGVQLLTTEAVQTVSDAPLKLMIGWFPGQLQRAGAILDRLPAGSLHDRAAQSSEQVEEGQQRATALLAETGCGCLTTANADSFGPIPCPSGCTTPSTPGASGNLPATGGGSGGNSKRPGGGQGGSSSSGSSSGVDYPPAGGSVPTGDPASSGPASSGGAGTSPRPTS